MFRRFLLTAGALLVLAASSIAQTPPAADPPVNAALNRKIEVMIRTELSVPPEYQMSIGPKQKSDLSGYDTIAVTFSLPNHPDRNQTVDFLLSKDGNTLARLSKWNIGPDPAAMLPTDGRPVRGDSGAKVTIVNFDDLECPFCARMNAEFFPETLDHYKGLVRFVYLDYPLVEMHPWAMHAAVDANCLAVQNPMAYWGFVDYVHTHGQDVSGPDNDPTKAAANLDKLARQQGEQQHVDSGKLDACLAKQDESKVQAEMKAGDKLGVNATPTFFVNGERWAGQLEVHQLWIMIDRALRAEGVTPPSASAPPASQPSASAAKPGQ